MLAQSKCTRIIYLSMAPAAVSDHEELCVYVHHPPGCCLYQQKIITIVSRSLLKEHLAKHNRAGFRVSGLSLKNSELILPFFDVQVCRLLDLQS